MLKRWLNVLEWLNVAVMALLPLLLLGHFSAAETEISDFGGLYLLSLFALGSCFLLRKRNNHIPVATGFAWLEQYLLLGLLLLLLWMFYLPQAPFSSLSGQLSWLSCQLSLLCLALRCWLFWYKGKIGLADVPAGSALSEQPNWLVGYASQSGTAERLARQSASQLQQAGFQVELAPLNALSAGDLPLYRHALFVVSTYGEGEPPDNASQFYKLAAEWQGTLDGLQFAVLALGDRSYQQFCAFGHWLYQWLAERQASPLSSPVELDSTQSHSQHLSVWQQVLTSVTKQQPVTEMAEGWQQSRLLSRYEVNPASSGLPCFVVKLQIPEQASWQAGDLVDIQPQNSKHKVTLWLTKHNLNGCQPVNYQQQSMPLCWALGLVRLPAEPPVNGADIQQWLEKLPLLPVRTYSVASLPEEGQLMLLVRQVKTEQQELGIGSGWLTAWATENQPLRLKLRSHSNFHLPPDDKPIIFIGNGTGIAGLRSLLAERVKRGHQRNWLLFGERKQATDLFFAKDIQQWQQQGYLPELTLAFSQDQTEKCYVQHKLAQQQQQISEWLAAGAAVYICGSLEGMGKAVHQVLLDIVGEQQLTLLQQQGLYRRDLY